MKAVPINHDGDFRKSRLLFPDGVCVGCAKKTDKVIEERDWGYSNAYFRVVSIPMCEPCVQIERERKKLEKEMALVELKNNQLFLIPGVAVGALLGLCLPFVLLQWFGWGVVIAVAAVGLILGAIGGLVIGGLVARQCDDRTRKAIYNKWAAEHPNLPDPGKRALHVSQIYYGPKLEKGRRYTVDGVFCQCDAYGEALLRVPYYSAVNEMVEGKISFSQLVEKVKNI